MTFRHSSIGALLGILAILPGGAADAATNVGVTSAVNPRATGTQLGGAPRTLVLGKKVFYNERIKTSAGGMVQLLLLDGSAFTIGPGSELRIDKFVYDPNRKTGKMVANFVKGAFRFVGGSLSKNRGGVTIRTSIATLGVRGGVVSGRVDQSGHQGNFNFLFGDQMAVGTNCSGIAISSCRRIKRVFQNGNTVHVNPAGHLDLRRTSRQDIAAVQKALAGKKGKSGGARRKPTSGTVARSGIGRENSGNSPQNTAPPPKSAVKTTSVVEVETVVVRPDAAAADESRAKIITVETVAVKARLIEAAPSYTINTAPPLVIQDGWRTGLLGGSPAYDYTDEGKIENGRLSENTASPGGSVPWRTGHFSFTDGRNFDGSAFSGRGYVSSDEKFFFYEMDGAAGPSNDGSDAFFILGGKAPVRTAASGNTRIYNIHPDMLQGTAIPFGFNANIGSGAPAMISAFYLKEQTSGNIGIYQDAASSRSVTLQASLLIDGTGRGQHSYVMVHAGTVFDTGDGNGPRISTALRGSFRSDGPEMIAAFAGRVDTLQGPEKNFFFGDNMENFVIGNDPRHEGSFHISYANPLTPSITVRDYGTTHLATLSSTTSAASLPAQSSRLMNGFAAGFMERGSPFPAISKVMSSGVLDTEILFNASSNRLRANLNLNDYSDPAIDLYVLAFGSDPSRTGSGHSAFLDDNTYAAIHNREGTSIRFSNGTSANFPAAPVGSENPNTYFLGSELVPVTNFAANVNFCNCKFLEWGYWGGRLKYEDPANPGSARKDYAHLNTWAAGVITAAANWPASGSATYQGHVIGNVMNALPGAGGRYLAAGNFNMSWNFASRTGNAAISNFDGRNMSAPSLFQSTGSTSQTFEGLLGNGETAFGKIIGAFAAGPDSPVQGAIGQFEYSETGYTAVGNIISEKTN